MTISISLFDGSDRHLLRVENCGKARDKRGLKTKTPPLGLGRFSKKKKREKGEKIERKGRRLKKK